MGVLGESDLLYDCCLDVIYYVGLRVEIMVMMMMMMMMTMMIMVMIMITVMVMIINTTHHTRWDVFSTIY